MKLYIQFFILLMIFWVGVGCSSRNRSVPTSVPNGLGQKEHPEGRIPLGVPEREDQKEHPEQRIIVIRPIRDRSLRLSPQSPIKDARVPDEAASHPRSAQGEVNPVEVKDWLTERKYQIKKVGDVYHITRGDTRSGNVYGPIYQISASMPGHYIIPTMRRVIFEVTENVLNITIDGVGEASFEVDEYGNLKPTQQIVIPPPPPE